MKNVKNESTAIFDFNILTDKTESVRPEIGS
jgi:hypothetical protein